MTILYAPPPPAAPADIRIAPTVSEQPAAIVDVEAAEGVVPTTGSQDLFEARPAGVDSLPGTPSGLAPAGQPEAGHVPPQLVAWMPIWNMPAPEQPPATLPDAPEGHTFSLGSDSVQDAPTSAVSDVIEAEPAVEGSINRQMLEWYTQRENYDLIYDKIGHLKSQCAHFAVHALEMSGALTIPEGTMYVGFDDEHASPVRTWSPSLARYLEEEKGWIRIAMDDLQPGDIIFTTGEKGTYNHTTIFQSWFNKDTGFANVLDNQGFTHQRSLPGGGFASPMMYAVRSPE